MSNYIRKKPASPEKQTTVVNIWLEYYCETEDDDIRENILNTFIKDFKRNFYSDAIFGAICETIDMIDNEEEGYTKPFEE